MKICKDCGIENQENNAFCPACGGNEFLHRCASCGAEFEGNFCPNCGAKAGAERPDRQSLPPEQPKRKVTFGRVLLWIFFLPIMAIIAIWRSRRLTTPVKIALTGLIVLACVFYYQPKSNKTPTVQATERPVAATTERPVAATTERAAQPKVTKVPVTKKPTATPKPTAKPTPKPTEDPTPKEYRNALAKAQLYVNMMHMSKARLHDQLTSPYGEGFSEEAAQYALEHVKADWKKNALITARNYRDNLHMSAAAIQTQLTSPYGEQFTEEEAQYAMEHLDD